MINLLVPCYDIKDYKKMFSFLKEYENVNLIVGVCGGFKKVDGAKVLVFEKGTTLDDMIETMKNEIKFGKIIAIKRPISQEEFDGLIGSKRDIAYLKRETGNVGSFFEKVSKKIEKSLFGFETFEDISAISYSEQMFDLIENLDKFATLFKVNYFVGYSKEAILSTGKKAKPEIDRPATIFMITSYVIILVASIVSMAIFFAIANWHFLYFLLYILGNLILWWVMLYGLCKEILHLKVGYFNIKNGKIKKENKKRR